ncbi:MAG TPA: hypothetical protein VL334_17335 [Anaerolineae bacterium]|nr:hypothetical protein [Anaerolineae bacterium]
MRGAWRRHVGALWLYGLLALAMTWPLARQVGAAIPGDSFDGWQNVWNLWWMREAWLVQHGSAYFTALLHAPTGVDLRFQTMAPFNGLATLPIQLTAGLLPAYNAAVLLSFVLGGYGAYLLALYALRATLHASRFTLHASAFLAGVIFAFSPYHFAHLLGHLQLIALQWIPFYVLYLLRGLDRHARSPLPAPRSPLPDALKAGFFLILVGLVDWYYVMYCLLYTGFVLVIYLIQRRLTWRGVGVVAGAVAFFGLALSPLLLPMVQAARSWSGTSLLRGYQETLALSADLLAFVTPQVFHPLWGDWALARSAGFTATPSEYTVFAGFTVLALCGIAFVVTRKRRKKSDFFRKSRTSPRWTSSASPTFYLLSAAIFALLALGPVLKINGRTDLLPGGGEIPLPYRLLYEFVPFVKLSRSVSRMDVMVMLFLGVGAAFGVTVLVDWLIGRLENWKIGRLVAVATPLAAIGLVLFEFWPAPYPVSPPDTPAWYATLAEDPAEGAVLNLPANYERPWYLLYQTVHGKPLATGYVTRDDPAVLRERAPVLNHFWLLGPDIHTQQFDLAGQGVQVLHDLLGVRWVVLDRYKMPGGPEREVTDAYAQSIFAGQAPLYEDERITVYAVGEPAQRGPYLILGIDWQGRQSDDAGQVWRELPAAQPASVELINPDGEPLALEITAAGQGMLQLLDETGRKLATWPLEDSQAPARLGPVAIPPEAQTLRLVFDGLAGAAAVYGLDVTAAR